MTVLQQILRYPQMGSTVRMTYRCRLLEPELLKAKLQKNLAITNGITEILSLIFLLLFPRMGQNGYIRLWRHFSYFSIMKSSGFWYSTQICTLVHITVLEISLRTRFAVFWAF
nr:unnamed protein product [Callosobruchus analis]